MALSLAHDGPPLAADSPLTAMERELVEGHRDNGRAYFALGESLLKKRFRLKQAAEAAKRGLALEPDAVAGHDLLGRIALGRKRWKEAEVAYRRALALDPENRVLMNNIGIALRGQRRQREATEAIENAAPSKPTVGGRAQQSAC